MTRIQIRWPAGCLAAELAETPTARQILALLPQTSTAQTWGEEVYFSLPVDATLEADARQVVDPGTICFWVEGASLALPYGPTPVSRASECRLVTPVNVLGHVLGDPRVLASVRDGDTIAVETLT